MTNLSVKASIIYPICRLRWPIELIFKTGKSSFKLADALSSDDDILFNLLLASIMANLIAQPIARATLNKAPPQIQAAISMQRAGFIFVHVATELMKYLIDGTKMAINQLIKKLHLYAVDLIDPNCQLCPNSMEVLAHRL